MRITRTPMIECLMQLREAMHQSDPSLPAHCTIHLFDAGGAHVVTAHANMLGGSELWDNRPGHRSDVQIPIPGLPL